MGRKPCELCGLSVEHPTREEPTLTVKQWQKMVNDHIDSLSEDIPPYLHKPIRHLAALSAGWGSQQLETMLRNQGKEVTT